MGTAYVTLYFKCTVFPDYSTISTVLEGTTDVSYYLCHCKMLLIADYCQTMELLWKQPVMSCNGAGGSQCLYLSCHLRVAKVDYTINVWLK